MRRKSRAVVDIRGLNKIAERDAYPLPLQGDIISAVRGCHYITVVDSADSFYQWLVAHKDRHKFTVLTHRGSEYFKVAVMGFKNSPPFVQRKMDSLLREFRTFCNTYVDDTVIFSATLEDHLCHLHAVFGRFQQLGITLKPTKAFIGFPSVTLLGQQVDGMGLSTDKGRIAAIRELKLPATLQDLEHYLGLVGWLRQYIPCYAQCSAPLQERKTRLLRNSPKKGNARHAYVSKTQVLDPTPSELQSFEALQSHFQKPSFLHHLDPCRPLFVDVDSSKQYGHGAILYHVLGDPKVTTIIKDGKAAQFPKSTIQPILFLSKRLSVPESHYWPTELEVAGLVWVVKKTWHFFEAGQEVTTVFTDHSAATVIANQTNLSTASSERLNLRLIRASQYLSQFDIDVKYRPGKIHLVPDALSRLLRDTTTPPNISLLDELTIPEAEFAFTVTLVEMSPDFQTRLLTAYANDSR